VTYFADTLRLFDKYSALCNKAVKKLLAPALPVQQSIDTKHVHIAGKLKTPHGEIGVRIDGSGDCLIKLQWQDEEWLGVDVSSPGVRAEDLSTLTLENVRRLFSKRL
jgi:hypothetical protein